MSFDKPEISLSIFRVHIMLQSRSDLKIQLNCKYHDFYMMCPSTTQLGHHRRKRGQTGVHVSLIMASSVSYQIPLPPFQKITVPMSIFQLCVSKPPHVLCRGSCQVQAGANRKRPRPIPHRVLADRNLKEEYPSWDLKLLYHDSGETFNDA